MGPRLTEVWGAGWAQLVKCFTTQLEDLNLVPTTQLSKQNRTKADSALRNGIQSEPRASTSTYVHCPPHLEMLEFGLSYPVVRLPN